MALPKVNIQITASPAKLSPNTKFNQLKRRQTSVAGSFNYIDEKSNSKQTKK